MSKFGDTIARKFESGSERISGVVALSIFRIHRGEFVRGDNGNYVSRLLRRENLTFS